MNSWNTLDACAIAKLNDNLVISHWFPGNEKISGLSLVGTKRVDESICTLFDAMREDGRRARLVHVPEFVLKEIAHPDMYKFRPERSFDEYVYDFQDFYPLERNVAYRRNRIHKFVSRNEGKRVEIKSVDLSMAKNKSMVLNYAQIWSQRGVLNRLMKHTDEVLNSSVVHAENLAIEAICLYVDECPQAFLIFNTSHNRTQVALNAFIMKYELNYTFDYVAYAFAGWFIQQGVRYINLDSDMGVPFLRGLKLAFGPSSFFRKYTIEPAIN